MPVTYRKIATVTVTTATQAAIEFTSIPATYTDLLIYASLRGSDSGVTTNANLYINGVNTNQAQIKLTGNGSTAASSTDSNILPIATGSTATASTFSSIQIYIPNYAGATNKSFSIDHVTENNATTADARLNAGLWSQTTAITSLSFDPGAGNLAQYSTATLYGIKKD
jgi:hypothetical protein